MATTAGASAAAAIIAAAAAVELGAAAAASTAAVGATTVASEVERALEHESLVPKVPFTQGQIAQFENQLAGQGPEALQRSRERFLELIGEHLQKIGEVRETGGYTSSMEKEVRNFIQQINAIDEVLGRHP